jgi:hypothetical protein
MNIVDKIKSCYRRRKRKRTLKKRLELEMIDTICTLCRYIYYDSKYDSMSRANCRMIATHFNDHFEILKALSYELQGKDM